MPSFVKQLLESTDLGATNQTFVTQGKFESNFLNTFRGCSHMMSAENGGVQTPSPPLVSQKSEIGLPPSPPCHKKSEIG